VKSQLSRIQGSGAYLIYAALDDSALTRLPSPNFIVAENEPHGDENLSTEFTVSIGEPAADGKRPMTIKSGTDVAPWFSFQTSEEDYEQWDQTALAKLWESLHQGAPELGASVEVIESANPRTFYDLTRRKLGMVLAIEATAATEPPKFDTSLLNLFIVSDTVSNGFGVSAVVKSALLLANQLTK
jgi:phytoene dehydrogenase-like protein